MANIGLWLNSTIIDWLLEIGRPSACIDEKLCPLVKSGGLATVNVNGRWRGYDEQFLYQNSQTVYGSERLFIDHKTLTSCHLGIPEVS